ncbi:hypothetical protein N7474_005368 [Penicillium riverlandense]|uniref:uncharacterized protein n=1 Tax=Penicillium riverlandense TaxID=1903569 RepID=UPI0025472A62|nr:uncharacterized protein N7474_005368 [Penicillium riverlandense]KAJ5819777.1 hypothetical protein N7474_005368 [Penicillium riverlandense]
MFDILEADLVVFQETKIQRKDLNDDIVLVPGWDCYFSLPRVKKAGTGYSGVVIYTRNATCSPIRAEEGITGVLCPPNSSVSFRDLPAEQQIGGYPTSEQLARPIILSEDSDPDEQQGNEEPTADTEIDATTLDSEGRCVILEFPAFVLIGVYCPANRDESRHCFRISFLNALDARIRNLVALGKRVVVTGDINISRGAIDAAHALEAIRKNQTSEADFISTPPRRLFNQLLSDGVVIGEREQGRERPVLHDLCRKFHPDRAGMYTCWEQRINARPGNYGSRIDYVLCSEGMQEWFADSNIQEGLMVCVGTCLSLAHLLIDAQGSDHCPVYAVLKDIVSHDGEPVHIRDLMNPPGAFKGGERQQEYSAKFMLPTSGRLLPEFDVDKRRSIKDMFARKPPSTLARSTSNLQRTPSVHETEPPAAPLSTPSETDSAPPLAESPAAKPIPRKRSQPAPIPSAKRSKSTSTPSSSAAGQKTLKGFFKPKSLGSGETSHSPPKTSGAATAQPNVTSLASPSKTMVPSPSKQPPSGPHTTGPTGQEESPITPGKLPDSDTVIDPIVSKEDWSKLFTRKPVPRCEGHQEPCISMKTKKPGINCGRAFWICARPLGPSGNKEKGTQWRCPTFIWASDWNSSAQEH